MFWDCHNGVIYQAAQLDSPVYANIIIHGLIKVFLNKENFNADHCLGLREFNVCLSIQTLGLETTIPLAILWIHGVAVHLTLLLKYLKENFIMVHSWIFGWVTIDIIYFTQRNIHWNPMHESHNCAAFYMVKYCPWTFIQRTTLL